MALYRMEIVAPVTALARPGTQFDAGAVVEQVGKDPQALAKWVGDNTRWVPYRGMLRGPRGVLMDGVGNALDRSLLLAELLRIAQVNVRLAHATLSEAK